MRYKHLNVFFFSKNRKMFLGGIIVQNIPKYDTERFGFLDLMLK